MTTMHNLLSSLATANSLPTKGLMKTSADLVDRGLARFESNKRKITITPAGAFAARSLRQEAQE